MLFNDIDSVLKHWYTIQTYTYVALRGMVAENKLTCDVSYLKERSMFSFVHRLALD